MPTQLRKQLISATLIFDLCNLKAFCFCRLGSKDFYSKFAALGRPNNTVSVFLNEVYEREPSSVSECPAAVLIGIDVSVKPGLAGASFFGQASAALLTDIDRALEAATTKLRCCQYESYSGHL